MSDQEKLPEAEELQDEAEAEEQEVEAHGGPKTGNPGGSDTFQPVPPAKA